MVEHSWTARAERVLAGGPGTFSKHMSRYPQGIGPEALIRGDGCYVWGTDGRRYLDTVSALGPLLLGYNHPAVTDAILDQLAAGTSFSMLHPLEVEVGELLCEILPCAEMCRFARNGTDVTNMAIRLARAFTGKRHALFVGYHGGGSDSYGITTDKRAGILPELARYNHQIAWGDFVALAEALETSHDDLAVIMAEVPSRLWGQNRFGHWFPDVKNMLHNYTAAAHRHGALFVLDEIVTFPRYHLGGAQTLYGVTPDLCTISKALANGLPLAALVGKRQVMDRLNIGDIFASYTFSGETTALAAAKAVLTTLRDTDALANLQTQGQRYGDGLQALFREYALPVTLLGNYARLAVRWQEVPGVATSQELRTLWLAEQARRGVLAGIGVVFPQCCWASAEVDLLLRVADEVCALIRAALDTQMVQAALPCAVIDDVLAVRA